MSKGVWAIFAIALIIGIPSQAVEVASPLRGYSEINQIIQERIVAANSSFRIGKYLGENAVEPSTDGLLALLGTYAGSDTNGEFRNGSPNSVSMLLYYLMLSSFSSDIGDFCESTHERPFRLRPEFLAVLQPLCAWPTTTAKENTVLFNYWSAVTGFNAPKEEYKAWRQFFRGPDYVHKPARETIAAMTLAILFNPNILLRR